MENIITKLQEAQKLADAGDYKAACELLFGDGVSAKPQQEVLCVPNLAPGFELVEDDGCIRMLKEAEAHWKARGYEMALLKHFYALADSCTPEQLDSFREVCYNRWILCGRLDYQGEMVSVNGGKFINCPEYRGVLLAEVLSTSAGLKLFQAFCGTNDGADAICAKFEKLSGMGRERIKFWTSSMVSRKAYPSRAAWLYCDDDGFLLDGDSGSYGRSFGVRVRER